MEEISVDSAAWSHYIFNSINYDFYHTASYHRIESAESARLLIYHFGQGFIGIPLIFRDIPGTPYQDCTSVYGYCGPVSNKDLKEIPPEVIAEFHQTLKKFLREKGVVSVFLRLHPLFEEYRLLEGLGRIREVNKTVAIDVTLPESLQVKNYRGSLKNEIISLKNDGFYVEEKKHDSEVEEFSKIYHETMKRVKAEERYFFKQSYFEKFLSDNCFNKILLLAKKNNEVIAGALFTVTGKIMQYHLAGTWDFYRKEPVMKMVIDEARKIACHQQLEFLHLGGGVNGSDEDNLFKFKSAFSKNFKKFRVWEYIVNDTVYAELSAHKKSHDRHFFPAYRR